MLSAAVYFSQILPSREIVISPYKLRSSDLVKLPIFTTKRIPRFSIGFSLRTRMENTSTSGDEDAVIVVDHGSRRKESNLMLSEFVTMFKARTGYMIVEPAHMELAEPSIKDAFNLCVQQGAKRIIVSPYFLSPGRHWHKVRALAAAGCSERVEYHVHKSKVTSTGRPDAIGGFAAVPVPLKKIKIKPQDIPSLAAEAASEHSGISYIVTAPLGLHELMVDVMNDRIKQCLSHAAGEADECNVCSGTGRCRLYES